MAIDWLHFSPWTSLLGGALIGLAAGGLMFSLGRIAGISGILAGMFSTTGDERVWRVAFVLGLLTAPVLARLTVGLPVMTFEASPTTLVVAGLLVGLGTRYGFGCTSGHGICGLSRLSARSLAATLLFMAGGFVTVYGMRHVLGGAA